MCMRDREAAGGGRRNIGFIVLGFTCAMIAMVIVALTVLGPGHDPAGARPIAPKLGKPIPAAQLAGIDQTVMEDGAGLPVGEGTPAEGAAIYAAQCAACHGSHGQGGVGGIPALTGGIGTLASAQPRRTMNSFWPYAPPAFDYIRRAMPPTAPQSLGNDEIYAVLGYLLSVDGIVAKNARLNRSTLAQVRMPNRNGFVSAR